VGFELRDVEAPHEPDDAAKVAALVGAYGNGEAVTPVVVIDWSGSDYDGLSPMAISGSHRLAAMREVYNDENDIELFDDQIIVVDGDQLLRDLCDVADGDDVHQAANARQAMDELNRLAQRRSVDLGTVCHLLVLTDVLQTEAAEALSDQF